jgi:heme/copper-type cytochrome/quinol oxidase subunit 2
MKNQWAKLFAYFLATSVITIAVLAVPEFDGAGWLPANISNEADSIDKLFWGLVVLSVVILSIVTAVVFYCATHFKADRKDLSDGAPIHGSHKLEAIWTIIPTIIVFVVGIVSYVVLVDNEAAYAGKDKTQTVVQVRGFSFGWAFHYGERTAQSFEQDGRTVAASRAPVDFTYDEILEEGTSEDEAPWSYEWTELADPDAEGEVQEVSNLVLPLGKPVFFEVMSCSRREPKESRCGRRYGEPLEELGKDTDRDDDFSDVSHAFWVPEARLKIDTVPGIPTWTQWTPSELTQPTERYQVVCAELCGSGHNGMRVDACIVDDATFEWWTENAATACDTLRFFNCESLSDASTTERDGLRTKIEELVTDEPDATCDDVEDMA